MICQMIKTSTDNAVRYGQANMLARKFNMCSTAVKVALFRAFCTPLYTAHLWRAYRKSNMKKLTVAYNDGMRMLLRIPRWSSASQMFVNVGVPTCHALIRNLMYRFMCRLTASENSIIQALVKPGLSSVRFSSTLWRHWRACLYSLLQVLYADLLFYVLCFIVVFVLSLFLYIVLWIFMCPE